MIRDYENTPRPKVEDHPHIRELIERQEVRTQDRIYHQRKDKNAGERMSDIKAAPWKEVKEFYCTDCRSDFFSEGIKEAEMDWTNSKQYIAFYRSKCPKGHWCMRLITDRFKDTFYFRSRKIARDRGEHALDMVQEWESGHELLYGRRKQHAGIK